jgi:hypothetical protein
MVNTAGLGSPVVVRLIIGRSMCATMSKTRGVESGSAEDLHALVLGISELNRVSTLISHGEGIVVAITVASGRHNQMLT